MKTSFDVTFSRIKSTSDTVHVFLVAAEVQETRGVLLGLHVPKAGLDAAGPDDKLLKMVPEQSAFVSLDLAVLDRLVVKQRVELNGFVRCCTVFILENSKVSRCQVMDCVASATRRIPIYNSQ